MRDRQTVLSWIPTGFWYQLGSVVFAVGIWHVLTAWFPVTATTLIPSPGATLGYTVSILTDPSFLLHTGETLFRTAIASALALVVGVPVGIAMGWNRTVNDLLSPQLSALYPMPVVALLPLLLLIFSNGSVAIVFAAAFGGFFLVVWNAMVGVQRIQDRYVDAARDNGVHSPTILFREVLLPGSLPMILVGFRLCLYTALLIVIAAEMLFGSSGLGYVLWVSYQTYALPDVYGTLVVVGGIGLVFTYGLDRVTDTVLVWKSDVYNRTGGRHP